MSNNDGGGTGGGGLSSDTSVAIVALVVSVIALVGTILQVLQQYLASAAGYSNCGEKVIGEWSKSKHRQLLWKELRFEVQFEAPVIFVCPPSNKNGPVKGAEVWHIDGTDLSLANTRTRLPGEADHAPITAKQSDGVHTADNEQSTWVVMLQELQRMERDSDGWQDEQYKDNPPRNAVAQFSNHTLCVAVQAKKRSWDSMPDAIKKPYAVTTMCHIVEMAAMLGIHWKEFDRSNDRYRGEGNGYVLTGTTVEELGIMFTFQICGKSRFLDNRLVPADLVKELAFGFVSTIFRDDSDNRRLEFPTEEPRDLSVLQLGSINEVAETLVSFGCNTLTSNIIRSENKRHGHLFPIAFEILGMLGKTLHIRNSSFRVVPNPSPYHWDKTYFNMRKLLREYKMRITDGDLVGEDSDQISHLQSMSERVYRKLSKQEVNSVSLQLLDTLHDALDKCDDFLKEFGPLDMVEIVLREHVQAVLRYVNNEGDSERASETASDTGGDSERNKERNKERKRLRFADLMSASPEERQERLMDIYFAAILPRVKKQTLKALHTLDRTTSSHLLSPSQHGHQLSMSPSTSAEPSRSPTPTLESPPSARLPEIVEPTLSQEDGKLGLPRAEVLNERRATNIWCTLVFRMLCWLLLHDFHKKDVQTSSKSELMGSRLPVYIA